MFVVFAALSCLNSASAYLSANSMAALAGFLGITVTLECAISSRRQWSAAVAATGALLLGSALDGLASWQRSGAEVALKSTFTNADCYSVIPLLGVFLALGAALEWQRWKRAAAAVAALLFFLALVLTGSRSGMLGFSVGYLGLLFTLISSRSASLRSTGWKLGLLPVGMGLLVLLSGVNSRMMQRFERLGQGQDQTAVRARWDVWRRAPVSVARQPLLGHGVGNFALAYQQVRPASSSLEAYMNVAHNDYLQWAVELGVFGGLCWLVLVPGSVRVAWRSFRSPTPRVAGMVGALLGVSVYQLFNFAVPVPADLLWIGAVLGLCGALPRIEGPPAQAASPRWVPLAVLMLVLGGWTVLWGLSCWRVERWQTQSKAAQAALDWETAILALNQAAKVQPSNFEVYLELAELNRRAFVFTGQSHWLDAENQSLKAALKANPLHPKALLARIWSLEQQGRAASAGEILDQAEQVVPYSPLVRRARARNFILQGQLEKAAEVLLLIKGTGAPADERALAELLVLLESKRKGESALLRRISEIDRERAHALGLLAVESARRQSNTTLALRLLQQVRKFSPTDNKILLQIALVRGESGDRAGELVLLDRLRKLQSDLDDALVEKVWQRWAQIQLEKGELDLLLVQLEDYLISHQRHTWARSTMAQVYLKRDQQAEARSALRAGLPYDESGELRVQLGDLCASQGLMDLARSYYRDALPMVKNRAAIETKLKALRKAQDPLLPEEDQLSEP